MTVIEPNPVLEENPIANNGNVEGSVEEEERLLDGGFVVLGSNAFGHSFRDYEKESERRATVEEFYRVNLIYQTYAI